MLQVGLVCEVSPEVSSGAQRRGQPTCTWSGEGRCGGTASLCQKHWRRSRKNCALRDRPVVQVTVNGLLVQGQVVAEHIVQDVRQNHGAEEPDVSAETAKRHQACRVAHSAGGLGCTRHGGLCPGQLGAQCCRVKSKVRSTGKCCLQFLVCYEMREDGKQR